MLVNTDATKERRNMKTQSILKTLKDNVMADSIGKNRQGFYVFRHGFFYTHGNTADGFAAEVSQDLREAGLAFLLMDRGEHNAPFRGGASIASSSHWYVVAGIYQVT